jgi:AcrR family transcriptional regulator
MAARMTETEARRSPGRPRSERADRAILEAALDLFVEAGFDAMTVEGVADRAGVGKTTVYRRWSSKEDLVSAAVGRLSAAVGAPDTGSVRGDLVGLAEALIDVLTSTDAGRALPRMAGEVAAGSALGRAYVRSVLGPRRRLVAAVLRRGIERGELPRDLDVELAIDTFIGPLLIRRLLGGQRPRYPRDLPARLADHVLDGIRTT